MSLLDDVGLLMFLLEEVVLLKPSDVLDGGCSHSEDLVGGCRPSDELVGGCGPSVDTFHT